MTLILSLLCIIVGHTAHICWLTPAYLLIDRVNILTNDTSYNYDTTHTYILIYKIHVMKVTRENHITHLIISFNISKARFYILLFDSVSVVGFILYCGATQALISLYIKLIKRNDQKGN